MTTDVALGHSDIAGYLASDAYFGATVGRYANRIAGGRFVLDGLAYQLPRNNGPNSLHGGDVGFDRQLWDVVAVGDDSVRLRLLSHDGDQGYPASLTVEADFALDAAGNLTIDYTATSDRATIVNLTNHAYWNLAGEGSGSAMDHVVAIHADRYTPVDATLIPTGELRTVSGTPFDFRDPVTVGKRVREASDPQIAAGRGYDHNYVFGDHSSALPRLMATVVDPKSGRGFELSSNQPGMQFYSGNFLDGTLVGKSGRSYRQGDAVVFEPQLFPDTPNRLAFGSARLDPGSTYRHRIVYRLFTAA